MSFFGKLLALLRGRRQEPPAPLTPADVRKARLQLEQIAQRIERSADDVRGRRADLQARAEQADDEARKASLAQRIGELDSLLAGWEQELADVARRRCATPHRASA